MDKNKRHKQNRIENDQKVENLLREDESDSEWNRSKEWNSFVKEKDQEITKTGSKNEKYKKRVYILLGREGSNKIEDWEFC